MSGRTKTSNFLKAMNPDAEPVTAPAPAEPTKAAKAAPATTPAKPDGRKGLKHIGGYFDRDTVEKVAVLRARLGLDNSALLKLAVEELHRKHEAKRAYGDA